MHEQRTTGMRKSKMKMSENKLLLEKSGSIPCGKNNQKRGVSSEQRYVLKRSACGSDKCSGLASSTLPDH